MITSIVKKVKKKYNVDIDVTLTDRSVILKGEMSDWKDIVDVGKMFVDKKSNRRVVNDIVLKGYVPSKEYLPGIRDDSLQDTRWNVVVIGAGIIGCSVARELSQLNASVLVVEKHSDVAHGASGANDGMVHAGIDLKGKSLKLHYVVRGNAMYGKVCEQLGVDFRRDGQYVIFKDRLMRFLAKSMLVRARKHNIPSVTIIGKEMARLEPAVASYCKGALRIGSTGAVSPYKLTIAYAENACTNGVKFSFDTAVQSMVRVGRRVTAVVTNRGTLFADVVINCAGVFADKVAEMAQDRYFSIHPRKGTDLLLDKNAPDLPQHAISLSPTLKGMRANKNTKGGGIVITVDGNVLLGPDAIETPEREDVSTTQQSVDNVFNKQKLCFPPLQKSSVIAYFSGVRASTYEEDFIIERSGEVDNLIHVAGIQSPGLTAAPAIALDVKEMAVSALKDSGVDVTYKQNWQPVRKPPVCIRQLDRQTQQKYISQNPDYGTIVCRCEEVSLGEIKDAVNNNLGVATVDGVKRRVRAGMGRCQGGFCMPVVMKTIAQCKKTDISQVRKGDIGSNLCYGEIKDKYRREE